MRETPGRRRRLRKQRSKPAVPSDAALTFATEWRWPVLPGAGLSRRPGGLQRALRAAVCACPAPDCQDPGAHPDEPPLLAASTDARLVRWWWERRPDAPVLLATGGPLAGGSGPSAVSLPAVAGARALATLDKLGVRTGPVVATPERWALLVAPYTFDELGELLSEQEWVPGSLRFHGPGGYLPLPPSRTGAGTVRWAREPKAGKDGRAPWLPQAAAVVDQLVAASAQAERASRLAN
jgi:hypothetical protein